MPAPRVLIFDLGNVVIAHDNDLLWERLAALCADPAATHPALRDAVRRSGIGAGRERVRDLYGRLVGDFAMTADYGHFLQAWNSHFSAIPAVDRLIARLAADYPLALLSNTNAEHWRYLLARYPVLHHFDAKLASHELGLLKPNVAIYRRAAAVLGLPPSQCFFTDDVQANVDGARAAGMDAELFRDAATLRRRLRDRGLPL